MFRLREPALRRGYYMVGYLLMAAAGLAGAINPSPNVELAAGYLIWLWTAFFIIGGLLAAVGVATDRWLGELVGLPLLISVFLIYGFSIGFAAVTAERWTGIPGALALGALAGFQAGRLHEINEVRREAMARVEEARARGDGGPACP